MSAVLLTACAWLVAAAPSDAAGIRRLVDAEGTIHLVSVPDPPPSPEPPARLAGPGGQAALLPGLDHGHYAAVIAGAGARYGVPPALITSIIKVESNFNPRAVSPKGAMGLMQLMPDTARMLGVRDAFDPMQNIDGGVRHLRALMERFGDDLPRVLAAYNAGEGAVQAHRGVPPYPESRQYVTRVLKLLETATPGGQPDAVPDVAGNDKDEEKEEDIRVAQSQRLFTLTAADGTVVWTNVPPAGRR